MVASTSLPETLHSLLRSIPVIEDLWVAYSGGLDSHVLLKITNSIREEIGGRLKVVHVNHSLNRNSGEWASHCQNVCDQLGLELEVIVIDARPPKGESPESWARRLRYEAIQAKMTKDGILLTAHHRDDQIETLLLQLLRGAGPKGLSAMPLVCEFGRGLHLRPLLKYSREELREYAKAEKLCWIEDDSNQNTAIDRNYLRHNVIPLLTRRWPGLGPTLSRVITHQVEAAKLLDELAAIDLEKCHREIENTLEITHLKELSAPRQRNLIRYWLSMLKLPLPSARELQHVLDDVVSSREDAIPCVSWQDIEIRRYRNTLFAVSAIPQHDKDRVVSWQLRKPLEVVYGKLNARQGKGDGIRIKACPDHCLDVRYRRGGEVIKPAGRRHHQELKKLMQEEGIPPWYRDRIPLLYLKDKLVAVPGFWIDEEFSADANTDAWQISWTGKDQLICIPDKM